MLSIAQATKIYPGDYTEVQRLSGGHIHQTYRVAKRSGGSLVFQRFNSGVFKRKDLVQENYLKALKALEKEGLFFLPFFQNSSGGIFFDDDWRVCDFLEGSSTSEICGSEKVAFEAGKLAGSFLKALSHESGYQSIIDNFHSPKFRYDLLPTPNEETKALFLEIESLKELALKSERKPTCVTHNDLKLTNILFVGEEAKVVIDLDLIQPGSPEIDFGDLLRSVATKGAEDEFAEADQMLVKACISGFKESGACFDPELLALSPFVVSWVLGVRFLTDHLLGDKYFTIHYPRQNLKRAEAQIARAKMWLDRRESLLKELKNA